MAFDEGLAERVREAFAGVSFVTEKRMFGGLVFMVNGNMCCGIMRDGLMVRVGPHRYEALLQRDDAEPMDFTRKPMKGFISVNEKGLEDDTNLAAWVQRGLDFAGALPPK